jgi:D-alanyl-D-alanine carboxypeptidase
MRVRQWREHKRAALAALFCASALLAGHAADARAWHHRRLHVYVAPPSYPPALTTPSTDLGPTAPGVSSIVIDAGSGSVISENGADIPRYPASLTKLMTLDLAFQALRDGRMTLDTRLPVSEYAADVEPVKLGLVPGDTITVRQAILAMTTMSANDAATALGEYLGGGSEYRCAQMMTLRAHALGMAQSQFYNASGLPNPNQVTTARDLSILARDIVVNYPQDQVFFEVLSFDFNGHTVYSNNQMLRLYPGAMGMKTGYTILARHNLVTAAERAGRILIGVELHEPSWGATYAQMTALLDDGFGGHVDGGNATLLAARQPAAPSQLPPQFQISPPPGPSLFAAADAATVQPPPSGVTRDLIPGWTAQVGSYARMRYARLQALTVHKLRGVGIARIARLDRHGKVLWAAQLAGLTRTGAHETCRAMAARGDSCVVIAPAAEHLAMRDTPTG